MDHQTRHQKFVKLETIYLTDHNENAWLIIEIVNRAHLCLLYISCSEESWRKIKEIAVMRLRVNIPQYSFWFFGDLLCRYVNNILFVIHHFCYLVPSSEWNEQQTFGNIHSGCKHQSAARSDFVIPRTKTVTFLFEQAYGRFCNLVNGRLLQLTAYYYYIIIKQWQASLESGLILRNSMDFTICHFPGIYIIYLGLEVCSWW